ncbi:alpha/beta fold hydrolase [Nesterenkonia sp.]|uniref:alpha/beta fold hydrolase n=1 Tax=Nesterenkonia sp. TaxID=704201 RepID=UPI0026247CB7|nr:alpha/beta fold hydrolase [Nesterenkonia sp.]
MNIAPKKRSSRAARLTAVAAVGALAVGLVPASPAAADPVEAVPASNGRGHAAHPDAGVIAGELLEQEIVWEDCAFPSVDADTAAWLREIPVSCADITVPRDWHNPDDGETLTVRISVTDTADPDQYQGIALVNPGGPGGNGLPWGAAMAHRSPELAEQFNFIGFDPRGVGESTPLICEYHPVPDDLWEDGASAVQGCLNNPLTPYINTEQTVYDMDFVRALLGEEQISYIGYSYGTWLGNWYQAEFPEHSHRFVLDSATDLTRKSLQETWDLQPRSRDRQFQDMMLPYIARQHETYGLGEDPMAIRQAWEEAGGTRDPLGQLITIETIIPAMYTTGGYPAAAELITAFIALDLPEAQNAEELQAQLETLLEATREVSLEDPEENLDARMTQQQPHALVREEAAERVEREQAAAEGTTVTFSGTFEAIRCQDGAWNHSRGHWDAWVADLNSKAPFIGPLMSAPICAHWPAVTEKSAPHQRTHPDTLILQPEFDATTPYEAGQRSARLQPNTSLITVNNEGTHGVFPYGTTCVDDAVENYFRHGPLPGNIVCGALPLPGEDVAYQVGGDIHQAQQNVQIKMRTDAVKEANRMVRHMQLDEVHDQ